MSLSYDYVLKRIKAKEVTNLAHELVKVKSETGKEHDVVEFYAEILKSIGLEVRLQVIDRWNRSNVIGRIPGNTDGSPSLMLNGHLDTIPLGECVKERIDWDEGRIYGRGACDNKGALGAATIAGKALLESGLNLQGDLYIVGVVGEEGGALNPDGERWKRGTKALLESGFRTDAAVVMEGNPIGRVAIACKSNMRFDFTIVGADRIYHETQRPLTLNPLYWQAEVIKELGRLNEKLSKNIHPLVGPPTVNLGRVLGADFANPQINTVPMKCEISGIRRFIPGETSETVREEFENVVNKVRDIAQPEIQFVSKVTGEPAPWELSKKEPIVQSLLKGIESVTGVDTEPTGFSVQTDARWLNKGLTDWHRKYNGEGISTPQFGPSQPGIHSNIEYVNIDELVEAAKIYALTAIDFCGVEG